MRQDESFDYRKRDEGRLGDFGDETPRNSFSGGERDHLFLSQHGEQFHDLDYLSGLAHPGDGRTLCQLDYDRDGWIDFVVASANAPTIQLYRNRLGDSVHAQADDANMIALRYVGGNRSAAPSAEWSARNGYGAVARVHAGGPPLVREFRCGDGRAAQNSTTVVIGIGEVPSVSKLEIRWPSGRVQTTADVPAGSLVSVYEDPSQSPSGEAFVVERYRRAVRGVAVEAGASGRRLSLSLPAGAPRLNVVTAMSTHCAACKKAQADVALLRETFGPGDVRFFGVGTDLSESEADLRDYAERQQPSYEVLAGLPEEERVAVRRHVLETFDDDLTPVTIVTDAGGRVLETLTGVPTVSDLRRLLAQSSE